MKITLKDGSVKEYENNMSVIDIAKDISEGLARVACAGEVDGEVVDLRTVIDKDCELNILTFDSDEGKHAFRHTASHILAQAVKRLYPETKLAIGPSIDNGFYYDMEKDTPFTQEDLEKIEKEMKKIVKENLEITSFTKPRDEAIAFMKERNEPYKVELIEDLPEDSVISFYQQGEFVDLCAGPHLMTTKPVKAFKLTSIAGAYWRGDEHNQMLTRIYGTAFTKKAELDAYLTMMEEARKRDHRKLGKELGLFMMREEGPGFPFFLPKGMVLKNTLLDYWREIHQKAGYVEISTPIMLSRHLWETSGHWDHYKENMYTTVIDDQDFAIKPMNCPGGVLVYDSEPRSYRDLPLRMGELGLVHRHEKSGQLHGLMRVRCFTQDDAHIFMRPDQIESEVMQLIQFIDRVYSVFGLSYRIELSTRPEKKYIGDLAIWEQSEKALADACVHAGKDYKVNPGDGAFYGPKLDFHIKDSLGREWQCGTIQLDMNLPERFDLTYVEKDGSKVRPVMLHRVIFGSIERFIGILIEHFAGHFPVWLAPQQVVIVPVHHERHLAYAQQLEAMLLAKGVRVKVDGRNEKLGYRVREAQTHKIPMQIVVGDGEVENGTATVRRYGKKDSVTITKEELLESILNEIETKVRV